MSNTNSVSAATERCTKNLVRLMRKVSIFLFLVVVTPNDGSGLEPGHYVAVILSQNVIKYVRDKDVKAKFIASLFRPVSGNDVAFRMKRYKGNDAIGYPAVGQTRGGVKQSVISFADWLFQIDKNPYKDVPTGDVELEAYLVAGLNAHHFMCGRTEDVGAATRINAVYHADTVTVVGQTMDVSTRKGKWIHVEEGEELHGECKGSESILGQPRSTNKQWAIDNPHAGEEEA